MKQRLGISFSIGTAKNIRSPGLAPAHGAIATSNPTMLILLVRVQVILASIVVFLLLATTLILGAFAFPR